MQVKADNGIGPAAVKAWERPTLRRLPIAATAGASDHNEGQGQGKGQSGPLGS
jgi:hypothetical protein